MSQVNQTVISQLRRLIRDEAFQPGTKMQELPVADQLGVSRTPVRMAFRVLEQEGLLERSGKKGFIVRRISQSDVVCGIEIRGVLEGLAAKRMADKPLSDRHREQFNACLDDSNALVRKGELTETLIADWSDINQRFHSIILDGAGSRAIADAIARNNHMPFASADSIIMDTQRLDAEFKKVEIAHLQHQLIVQAIAEGDSVRAEMLMREHAYLGTKYGQFLGLEQNEGTGLTPD
ncbi:GntR family transcriptional regulator [Saccharospirillum impatiens]|uniref:GntR family transcriptional regulator n=1 Tax=Saccharospirillum impatiens TaxID=169438 RepID=UPI0003F77B88|nr:GntR family transcriptional regulator [Saccharospirillum impatiens]